ncbi:hypothetical protein G6F42_010248 [Rhizopus arrhizus]|nr:hypothetical protein G6F42_010248 [Rhizopus arrhizus]
MNAREKEIYLIDENLYRLNIMCQLRSVESNRAQSYKEKEKQVLMTLLNCCKDINGNKLRPIMNRIFERSIRSIPSKAMVMINKESNASSTKESTTLTSKAVNTTIAKQVAEDCNTSTNHDQNVDGKKDESYTSILERQLYDPKMSKVSVKIKQSRDPKRKAPPLYKVVLQKEHSIEKGINQKHQVKRRKTSKRPQKRGE